MNKRHQFDKAMAKVVKVSGGDRTGGAKGRR